MCLERRPGCPFSQTGGRALPVLPSVHMRLAVNVLCFKMTEPSEVSAAVPKVQSVRSSEFQSACQSDRVSSWPRTASVGSNGNKLRGPWD